MLQVYKSVQKEKKCFNVHVLRYSEPIYLSYRAVTKLRLQLQVLRQHLEQSFSSLGHRGAGLQRLDVDVS